VFLSSHLMSEIAQTAEHLVVVGRGRRIADTTVGEIVEHASREAMVVVRERLKVSCGRPATSG
jgi:ABC-2 type transport system ATP-binding protein